MALSGFQSPAPLFWLLHIPEVSLIDFHLTDLLDYFTLAENIQIHPHHAAHQLPLNNAPPPPHPSATAPPPSPLLEILFIRNLLMPVVL